MFCFINSEANPDQGLILQNVYSALQLYDVMEICHDVVGSFELVNLLCTLGLGQKC